MSNETVTKIIDMMLIRRAHQSEKVEGAIGDVILETLIWVLSIEFGADRPMMSMATRAFPTSFSTVASLLDLPHAAALKIDALLGG